MVKRILIFAAYFIPHRGGYENYILNLSLRLIKEGYKVDIFTNNTENTKAFENIKGIGVYRVPCYHLLHKTFPVPKIFKTLQMLKKLREKEYTIINCHTRFFITCLWALYFSWKQKVKLLHIEHGTCHSSLENKMVATIAKFYDHTLGWLIIKKSWKVAGVSEAAAQFVKHLCNRQTLVIHNGVDTTFFKKTKTNLKQRLGIKDKKVITFVGRLIHAKGIHNLFDAVNGLNVAVLIVGKGNYLQTLKTKAKTIQKAKILFLGEKNDKEIREILSVSDLFVNPSYSEGLPTNVLEAGAMGLPIIATDVGGTSEIITNNKNGLLIKPGDVKTLQKNIKQLLGNTKLSNQFGKRSREKVEKLFNWDKSIRILKKSIEQA